MSLTRYNLRVLRSLPPLDTYAYFSTDFHFYKLYPPTFTQIDLILRDIYMGVSAGNRQLIRRPRPNLMKLSGFVELDSLNILVTTFLKFDRFFTEIQVKNCRSISGIFAIFAKKRPFRLQRNRWNYIINRSNHKTNDIFWILASSCIRIPKN